MKTILVIVSTILHGTLCYSQTNPNDFPVMNGHYLGQKEPGLIPELFAPGLVSTGQGVHGVIF